MTSRIHRHRPELVHRTSPDRVRIVADKRLAETRFAEPPTVLVVEDEPSLRTALADILAEERYRVVTAADGRSAIEIATTEVPTAVLSDIKMPGMNGLELLRDLRAREETCHIPFVCFSSSLSDHRLARTLGAYDFIAKPISRAQLVVRIFHAVCVGFMARATRMGSPHCTAPRRIDEDDPSSRARNGARH